MTILVTGGAGFIGTNFVLNWLARSDEPVVNLDLLTYAGNLANLASLRNDPRHVFVRGDVGDGPLVTGLLRRYAPRALLHFAAESHVDRSIHAPGSFIKTNILGTYTLLEAVRTHHGALTGAARTAFRFVHVSTDEVYGSLAPEDAPSAETSAFKPGSPYSASKAASNHLVRAWGLTYRLPVLTTNFSNSYGPFQFPEKLIPLVITNALAGKALPIYGDGRQVRDWLHVDDHCSALRRVLEQGKEGETYNVGGWNEQPNIDVVGAICEILDELRPATGGSYLRQIAHVTDRPGHDRRYALDARKIERELSWRPIETFSTGLRKTVTWYLEHPQWLAEVQSGTFRDWMTLNYDNRTPG